jgi:hypothetical protein
VGQVPDFATNAAGEEVAIALDISGHLAGVVATVIFTRSRKLRSKYYEDIVSKSIAIRRRRKEKVYEPGILFTTYQMNNGSTVGSEPWPI